MRLLTRIWPSLASPQSRAARLHTVDRLAHDATILEMIFESYHPRAALQRKRGRCRPPIHATITANPHCRGDIQNFNRTLHDNHTATMMTMPRRQIPTLIVLASYPDRRAALLFRCLGAVCRLHRD